MNKKDITPIIVNGELNTGKRKVYKEKKFKQPKKNPLADFFLTLIGLVLVGYGVYTLVYKKEEKKDEIKNSNSNIVESNITSNTISTKKIDYIKDLQLGIVESTNVFTKEDVSALLSPNGLNIVNMSNNAKLALASKIASEVDVRGKKYITDEEMDISIKSLFGNITYNKESFIKGKNKYIYNQETKMYYLLSVDDINLNYSKYDYFNKLEENNILKVQDYVLYTDNTKSWTINNIQLSELVTNNNMKDKLSLLKYYEYTFTKNENNYYLTNIIIK